MIEYNQIIDKSGNLVDNFPAGYLKVTDEPTQLMNDEFDASVSLDTVNNWNSPVASGGGTAAATSAGSLTLGTGTTLSGYSVLTSRPSFRSSTPAWIRYAFNILLADGAAPIANTYRYWGSGAAQASPTAALPVLNGCGFEVGITGKMYAVVYNNGTRTVIQDLSSTVGGVGSSKQPLDANTHNYQIFYRPTKIYFYIDNVLVATAGLTQSALNTDTLPVLYVAVANTSAPASSGIISSNAMSVSDTGKNNVGISDGTYAYRKAKVGANGNLGTFVSQPDNAFSVNGTYAGAQTNTVLQAAPGAGLSLYITDVTISNGATAGTGKFVEDPAGTPADKIPAISLGINGYFSQSFANPIKLTANKALGFTSITATNHTILINGFIA